MITAMARMNDYDDGIRSSGCCVTLVGWTVTLGLTGFLEHMGVPRPSLRNSPRGVACDECNRWEPLIRVSSLESLYCSLKLAGSPSPQDTPLKPPPPQPGISLTE